LCGRGHFGGCPSAHRVADEIGAGGVGCLQAIENRRKED
jgi:hypothetical protein